MFVSRNLNIIKNVLSPFDLLTVEIVMHLLADLNGVWISL